MLLVHTLATSALATVRLRQRIGHQLEKRRRKGYANDNVSSHNCLINGIGLHGKTDSNDDSFLCVAKKWKPTWLQHHLDEHPVSVQMVVEAASQESPSSTASRLGRQDETRLKPLHERIERCGEGLIAWGRLWPVDEPRCDLMRVRHQDVRVPVSVNRWSESGGESVPLD